MFFTQFKRLTFFLFISILKILEKHFILLPKIKEEAWVNFRGQNYSSFSFINGNRVEILDLYLNTFALDKNIMLCEFNCKTYFSFMNGNSSFLPIISERNFACSFTILTYMIKKKITISYSRNFNYFFKC